jgi:hypothetical protein
MSESEDIQSLVVYELYLKDLQFLDQKWSLFSHFFLKSCTKPENNVLPNHSNSTYLRAKNGEPRKILDTSHEFMSKSASFCRKINANDDWSASNGKFQRDRASNHDVIMANRYLNSILNTPLDNHQRGNFYYPPQGYREWHTNQFDVHGWRLYVVHTVPDGCAQFNYVDPQTGEVKTCIDSSGCLRLFKVGSGDQKLWHSIVSEGDRWSLGYVINEETANTLIELYWKIKNNNNNSNNSDNSNTSINTIINENKI